MTMERYIVDGIVLSVRVWPADYGIMISYRSDDGRSVGIRSGSVVVDMLQSMTRRYCGVCGELYFYECNRPWQRGRCCICVPEE